MKIYQPDLREHVEVLTGHIAAPDAHDYILDEKAAFDYEILDCTHRCESGSATGGFYIQEAGEGGIGVSVTGLDPMSVTTTQTTSTATAANTVSVGDRVRFAIPAQSSSSGLAFTLRIKRV